MKQTGWRTAVGGVPEGVDGPAPLAEQAVTVGQGSIGGQGDAAGGVTTGQPRWESSKRSIIGMSAVVVALHLVGWGVLVAVVGSSQLTQGAGKALGLGIGVTVYALGLRHAFDADHIAAIDNATRKLIQDGQRPLSVGFWFSLGHSTVVFVACLLLAFGVRAFAGELSNDDGTFATVLGTIGTTVSAVFLLVLALINLSSFSGTARVVRRLRQGRATGPEIEARLSNQGVIMRLAGRKVGGITRAWQIYPVGFLFGLGFDTATEVGLLALTGGAAALALPWYAIVALPLIFAAGMSLLDTIDGCFMNYVYGWAFDQPVRKLYYNLTVTGISIVFALGIGLVEIADLLASALKLESGPLVAIASLDLGALGFILVGIFAVTALAVTLHKRRHR